MQAHPNISAAQLKIALQSGSTYMWDGGLMGGGAGSVNFWTSRKAAASGLTNLLSTVVGGVLTPAGGAVFWDSGSLTKRLYAGSGLRVLSLLEAPVAWLTGGYPAMGRPERHWSQQPAGAGSAQRNSLGRRVEVDR